ncbi:MAG: peptidylprolyl isomerase [Tepidibacter sp.]|jgi:peptidyl-prolyl cis-trans isomerase C|uniref:peptidylprolyl isomerase n=1 Tax=Tepidibacter sp. TaxID=2529387 RepID=UPI0025CE0956|nr:peptidylprolyl isomerase [Tepidibacter sp.]MCT4508034.1 peptidylprolyl isomerase [Tepidibacter sp.]
MEKKDVLAVVGTKEITVADVDSAIQSLGPQRAMQFQSEEGRKKLLEDLINQELFYLNAVENNADEEEEFKNEMKKIKENFLKQYAIGKLLSEVRVEEKEAKEFYENNKEQFKSPEGVQASHILVDDEAKAKEILAEINDGLSFEDAAKKYSKCPSKERGGDLGLFSKGQMVPEFENAAFSMEKGEVSEPVKTQFGYHIIKLTDKKDADTKSFDEVKDNIYAQLIHKQQQVTYFEKVEELKAKYSVTINE